MSNGKGIKPERQETRIRWVSGTDLLIDSEHTLSLLKFPQPKKGGQDRLDEFFSSSSWTGTTPFSEKINYRYT